MGFCDHCEGQRFDRAQVLRALRAARRDLREQQCGRHVDEALESVIKAVRTMDIPHLERLEDFVGGVVH